MGSLPASLLLGPHRQCQDGALLGGKPPVCCSPSHQIGPIAVPTAVLTAACMTQAPMKVILIEAGDLDQLLRVKDRHAAALKRHRSLQP